MRGNVMGDLLELIGHWEAIMVELTVLNCILLTIIGASLNEEFNETVVVTAVVAL